MTKTVKITLRGNASHIEAITAQLREFFEITYIGKTKQLPLSDDVQRVVRIIPPEVDNDDQEITA